MSIDFWCKKHGARTTQDGKCDVCSMKKIHGNGSVHTYRSKPESWLMLKQRLGCNSEQLEGIIGIDFAKRFDNVKYGMMFQPKTRAEETINWFLRGKKYSSAPPHFNCRCQSIPFKHISTEG